jgi:predicted RNase H-like HicB family nuclease
MKCRITYDAVISHESDGYIVSFPQLPDAFTDGNTRAEAISNAAEVLALIAGEYIDEGEQLPDPSRTVEVVSVSVELTDQDIESMKYLTLLQAADDLGVTPSRVSQLLASGKLKAKYFDGNRMVSIESVNEYKNTPRKAGRPRSDRTGHGGTDG